MKVPDIQHDNIHMLVIIESTFHMVGICTVLHKQRKRIHVIFRALDTDTYDQKTHCSAEHLHKRRGNGHLHQHGNQTDGNHCTDRKNLSLAEQDAVLDNIYDIKNYVQHRKNIHQWKPWSFCISAFHRENHPVGRIHHKGRHHNSKRQDQ